MHTLNKYLIGTLIAVSAGCAFNPATNGRTWC